MRITQKLIIFFSVIIVSTVGFTSVAAFQSVESSVIDSEIVDMFNTITLKEKEISNLHSKASEDIVFAVQNTKFEEYFELPDTRDGNNFDENGVMQFSIAQRDIKTELDAWIFHFQEKFRIDETCLIDITGQEHTRLVFKQIAPDYDLSPEEASASFFQPSFKKGKGEVQVQYPYVSPDSERWVFAYVTPVVLDDGEKPAIFHFEMPMLIFQDLVDTDIGRMYVVDPDGFLIADSGYEFPEKPISLVPSEDFPAVDTISSDSDFNRIVQEMSSSDEGSGTYTKNGETHYVVYKKLPNFGWILVYEKPYSLMLSGKTNLNDLSINIGTIATVIFMGGMVTVFTVSSRISNPIKTLAKECMEQNPTNLQKVSVKTSDEVSDVSSAINSMIDQVNQSEKQKKEFYSMISHELKNPLTPIKFLCDMFLDGTLGDLDTKQLNSIKMIERNSSRMDKLVSDILDAQKLDMGKMVFNKEKFNTAEFVETVEKDLSPILLDKEIEMVVKNSVTQDIISDEHRLHQVFGNLVKNAVDFIPEKTGKIEIGAQSDNENIIFYVKDNGTGMSKEFQKNLFKKFYQEDTSAKRKHGGTGLGLAVCKGIVNGLDGKIWVESEKGKGTTFYFSIPK